MPDLRLPTPSLRARLIPALRDAGKRTAGRLAAAADLVSPCRGLRGVLVYHRITEPVPDLPDPTWNVPPDVFENQIRGLKACGARFAALDEVLAGADAVAVTFDDVFGSVVTEALPILRRHDVPSTLFVSSAHVGAERLPFDDWAGRDIAPPETTRAATLAELDALTADPLVEIGAHTHSHDDFRGRAGAFETDLGENLRWLARTLGVGERERPHFAFPYGRTAYGYAGGELSRRARRAGVRSAFTTDADGAEGADRFEWPRANAYSWDTCRTLAAKLRGRYAWAPRLIERVGG